MFARFLRRLAVGGLAAPLLAAGCATPGFLISFSLPSTQLGMNSALLNTSTGATTASPNATVVGPLTAGAYQYDGSLVAPQVVAAPIVRGPLSARLFATAPDTCNLQAICDRLDQLELRTRVPSARATDAQPMPKGPLSIPPRPAMPNAGCD